MEVWIPLTIFAAFTQNIRSALQKLLKSKLSTVGTTHARFFYGAPFAVAYLTLLHFGFGMALPQLNGEFLTYTLVGGLAQVYATVLLVQLFSFRSFFAGAAFTRTEAIQTALIGLVVLGDRVSISAIVGISIGVAGLIAVSAARSQPGMRAMLKSLRSRSSIIGLMVGFFFGTAAICVRGASLSLEGGYLIQAAVTLTFMLVLQAVLISLYLIAREPGQMTLVVRHWPSAAPVGLSGMLASAGWFSAMTLQNAAFVKAVGQLELVFALLASTLLFRERIARGEVIGIVLIVLGILVLLMAR